MSGMSYDLAVWEGERPADAEGAAVFEQFDKTYAACVQMAVDRGLVCFDPQWDQLRPPTAES
jgi:hypothetical protein